MPGCFEFEMATKHPVRNERGFLSLSSGKNLFYQTWEPRLGGSKVEAVIVIFHGFGDHSDFTNALKAKAMVNLGNNAVMAFDMPGHGRSDGLSVCVEDWQKFVGEAREAVQEHLLPLARRRWGEQIKIFAMGESMGGGVLFTLLVNDKSLFHGAILVCPMLFVSRELLPPWIVVQIFNRVLVPLFPEWPVAPNKDVGKLCFEDSSMAEYLDNAPIHDKIKYKAAPRLLTAYQLAFVASEWMRERVDQFDVPALIIHGAADVVTDPCVSKELFTKMKHSDKQFMFAEGCWHADLFHGGPKKYDVAKRHFEEVVSWIKGRC